MHYVFEIGMCRDFNFTTFKENNLFIVQIGFLYFGVGKKND